MPRPVRLPDRHTEPVCPSCGRPRPRFPRPNVLVLDLGRLCLMRTSVGGRPLQLQVTGRWHIWEPLPIGRDRSRIVGDSTDRQSIANHHLSLLWTRPYLLTSKPLNRLGYPGVSCGRPIPPYGGQCVRSNPHDPCRLLHRWYPSPPAVRLASLPIF